MKKILFLLLLAAPAAALELSLEENRGESGTVGYVDIDRVFKEYSGTLNAREEFLAEIKKKEESVNLRKRDIYALKADIARLRQEREFALTLPSLLATQEQLSLEKLQAAAAADAASAAARDAASAAAKVLSGTAGAGTSAAQTSTSAPVQVQASTTAAVQEPASSSTTTLVQPPAKNVQGQAPAPGFATVPAIAPAATAASTAAVPAPAAAPALPLLPPGLPGLGIDMPGVAKVPVSYFKFSVSTAIPEIDAAITVKETDLRKKEDALKIYQRQVEKELLEYESHRSEILLGRIYIALKELAAKEEVSVIVDKRNILFGHSAVDLTGKLLEKLEEEQ